VSIANPLWGAPRVHGELLKLGIDVGQTTVAKYMAKRRRPLLSRTLKQASLYSPMDQCPCRKLKLEHIDGVVRPKVAPELCGLRFGWYAR